MAVNSYKNVYIKSDTYDFFDDLGVSDTKNEKKSSSMPISITCENSSDHASSHSSKDVGPMNDFWTNLDNYYDNIDNLESKLTHIGFNSMTEELSDSEDEHEPSVVFLDDITLSEQSVYATSTKNPITNASMKQTVKRPSDSDMKRQALTYPLTSLLYKCGSSKCKVNQDCTNCLSRLTFQQASDIRDEFWGRPEGKVPTTSERYDKIFEIFKACMNRSTKQFVKSIIDINASTPKKNVELRLCEGRR